MKSRKAPRASLLALTQAQGLPAQPAGGSVPSTTRSVHRLERLQGRLLEYHHPSGHRQRLFGLGQRLFKAACTQSPMLRASLRA